MNLQPSVWAGNSTVLWSYPATNIATATTNAFPPGPPPKRPFDEIEWLRERIAQITRLSDGGGNG